MFRLSHSASTVFCRTFKQTARPFSNKDSFVEAVVGSNPMFPQRPAQTPPPSTPPPNSSGNKGGFAPDFEESWLSKHAGKVGLAALFLTTGMLFNYYKSYRARVEFVEKLGASQIIEPYEIIDVRTGSVGMTVESFTNIARAAYTAALASNGADGSSEPAEATNLMITYGQFMNAIAPVLAGKLANDSNKDSIIVRSGHILDRAVQGAIAQKAVDQAASSVGKSVQEQRQAISSAEPVDYRNVPLPLGFLLTVVTMALPAPASVRTDLLFQMGTGSLFTDQHDALQATTSSQRHTTPAAPEEDKDLVIPTLPTIPFISATTFEGSKTGYTYHIGPNGLGYYVDSYGHELALQEVEMLRKQRTAALLAQVEAQAQAEAQARGMNGGQELSLLSVEKAVQHLVDSFQVPPERQVVTTGVKYPIEIYRRRTPADMLRVWRRDGTPPHTSNTLNQVEFRDFVLGNDVCAWGECWRRRGGN